MSDEGRDEGDGIGIASMMRHTSEEGGLVGYLFYF